MKCFFNPSRLLLIIVLFSLLTFITLFYCSDEGSDTSDLENISGVWELTTTVISNSSDPSDHSTDTDNIVLIQCDNEVSIIAGEGLWGSGTVDGNELEIVGYVYQTDESGNTIYNSNGSFSGNSSKLEGGFTTTITFDPYSGEPDAPVTIEFNAQLTLLSNYTSCFERDDFGDPEESEYILPWPAGKTYNCSNSYCIPTGGHREQQAYDFTIPVGDTIIAARSGVVRQIKESSPDDGQGMDHNHVMIEHEDGTVGFYAHLMQNGVLVNVNETVETGQVIAYAGHSGTTDIVHLHFGVYDSYPPQEGYDQAVNFRNAVGPLDCRGGLVNRASYTSQ